MRTVFLAAALLYISGGMPPTATALTVKRATIEELSTESPVVIHGRVLHSSSRWEGGAIYTYTEVKVIDLLKGETGSTVTVKQLGGTVGSDGLDIPGAPKMDQGEEVVLFLVDWKDHYWIHSVVLGMFTVVDDNGARLAINDLNNIGLIDPETGLEITDAASKTNAIPLVRFKEQIRSYSEK